MEEHTVFLETPNKRNLHISPPAFDFMVLFCRYFKRCEGSWSNHTWTVFWYGISNPKLSYGVVDWAVNHKTSFIEADEEEYVKEDSEVAEPW